MLALAVVGPIASGKSIILEALRQWGAATCSADHVARELSETDPSVGERLASEFGPEFRRPDGTLDRRALAGLIFRDAEARERLEALLHPPILERIEGWLSELRQAPDPPAVAAVEVLRLPRHLDAARHFDRVWLCNAPRDVRRRRLMARDGLSEDEAELRITVQEGQGIEDCDPDLVLDGGGTKEELRAQVRQAWHQMLEGSEPPRPRR